MYKFKKILSVALSQALIFSPLVAKGVYANRSEFSEGECWKDCIKNSKGGYESDLCAGKEAEKILLSGKKDYVVIKDVGPLANEEIYYFTFRALDKILDELGLDPNEDKLREELQRLRKERISYFSTLKNMLRVGISSLLGALAGQILPESIRLAMGIMIYAMFVAIVLPPMKKDKGVLHVVLLAALLSCAIAYLPFFNWISAGFSIILCAVIAAAVMSVLRPISDEDDAKEEVGR